MKQTNSLLLALLLLLLATVTATAQTTNPTVEGPRTSVRSDKGIAPVNPSMFELLATGGLLDDVLVKNKPLAAVFESENAELQANGTTTRRRVATKIYRDKDGRTRREQIFYPIGTNPSPGDAAQSITIYDPVARWGYSVNPVRQMASRYKLPAVPVPSAPFNNQLPLLVKILRNTNPQTGTVTGYTLEPPRFQLLGRQAIAGIEAEGARVTIKIPAGALGNATQMETVYETWISVDLRMLVKSVVSNPLSGTHTLLLKTINRSEQPRTLFEVPAGYPVTEMGVVRTDLPPPR